MYEIDPTMLSVARHHPEVIRLNRNALLHPKATIVSTDAQKMLAPGANFDVLTLDFPSISDGDKFTKLYSAPLYRKAKRALAPDGILVTQVTDFPWNLRQTIRNLKTVFPHVLPIYVSMGNSMFNFVMASSVPFRQRRALPSGLRFIRQTHIDNVLSPYQLNRKRQLIPEYALG
jgi:spermidine synthase